jgi:Protein of unknown function (DUF3617)
MRIRQNQWKAKKVLGLVVMLCSVSQAADKVQSLNIKPGLWEVTATVTTSGEMPIPSALLEKLTPEQRARINDRIEARESEPQKTTVKKQCLTRRQIEDGTPFRHDRKSCTRTVLTSTSSKVDMYLECLEKGVRSGGTLQIEAVNSERVRGSIHFSESGSDNTSNSNSTFTARWIGPSCNTPSCNTGK